MGIEKGEKETLIFEVRHIRSSPLATVCDSSVPVESAMVLSAVLCPKPRDLTTTLEAS